MLCFLARYLPLPPSLRWTVLIACTGLVDFQKCYAAADAPSECSLQKEDYLECLHHTKEVSLPPVPLF
jgi:hypothetical protein